MDFKEYAKWGIRVKEEPGTLGPFHLDKESNENNLNELQGGWMCKFPCDAQGALDTAATDNIPYELLESFEPASANCLEDDHEYFNLHSSDKFTDSTFAEGNNNTIPLEHPAHIIQQDQSAKDRAVFHNPLEGNDIVTSLSSSRETLKINVSTDKKQILDAVLNVQCDITEDISSGADVINQREYVQCLSKKTVLERPNEVAFITKNRDEILHSTDGELLDKSPENCAVTDCVKNSGTLDMTLNVNNSLSRKIGTLRGECIKRADQQNSRKENNNDFRISEISIFECPDCSEVLKSFNGFITHMNSHIVQQRVDIDTIQCKHCKEIFDDKRSLSLHKKVCKYAKESTLVPPQNEHNSSAMRPTVNCSEKNSTATNEQYALEENSELDLSSHCQETNLKKFSEQQSSQHQELLSFSPNRRQQVEECSSEVAESSNSWTVQNLGAADDAFDVSWSSEIKCREEREGKSLRSVRTLSLRLFRFRRPRVVVKRAQVPVGGESVIKTLNSCSEDSCSRNIIKEKAPCQEGNVDYSTLKQLTEEPVTSKVNKISNSDSKSCTSVLKPSRKQKHVLYSQKRWHYARQRKSADAVKCNLQTNSSAVQSEPQYEESYVVSDTINSFSDKISEMDKTSEEPCIDESYKFPSKDIKVRSNLKIKIKPVVVLDRLSSFHLNHNSDKSSKESTSKCVDGVSSQKNCPTGSNNSMDSSTSEKGKSQSKNMAKTFAEQSVWHHDPHCNEIKRRGNGISLDALERQYCLKKCYVKLKRISLETCALKRIEKHNDNKEETECEVRTCRKIKLRRTSSQLWTVSSCSSSSENMEVAECTEDCMKTEEQICVAQNTGHYSNDVELQSEVYDQRIKKGVVDHESKGSPITLSSPSEETLHKHVFRGKRVKRFRSECTWCQKTFFDEQDLEQHLETHLSGYKCPNCSARFHFVMELHAHVAGCSLASLLDCRKTQSPIKPCRVVL